jgi:hypothetical protein
LFVLFRVLLFLALVSLVLLLRFLAVRFCLFWVVFRVRLPLVVLRVLTVSCGLLFRPLVSFLFPRFWSVVVLLVLRLLSARLRWFLFVLRRAVCLLLFRSVRVLLVCLFLLRSVAVVRVRGVLWRLLSGWVFLCLLLLLLVLALRGLVRLLLRSAVLVLLRVAVLFGVLFPFLLLAVSLVYFSGLSPTFLNFFI